MWSETAWGCGMTDWMTMWLKTSGATTNRLRFILLAGHPWLDILCSHPLVSVCRDAMMKYRTTLCSSVKRVWCVGIIRPSRACSYARAYEKLHAYGGLHADVCGDAWCACFTREVRGGVHVRVMLRYMRAVLHAAEDELYQDYLMKNVKNSAFLW